MAWYLKHENDDGAWWWQRSGMWCDRYQDAHAFTDEARARQAAMEAAPRCGAKVRVVKFKEHNDVI